MPMAHAKSWLNGDVTHHLLIIRIADYPAS